MFREHYLMERACVGRVEDGLCFADVKRGPDGAIWSAEARLRTPGLDAVLQVSSHYATGFADLVMFFQRLATDWRGWEGARSYESLEKDLRLSAAHDGHVRLVVNLAQTSTPGGWSVSAVLTLEPGEEMTRAAGEVAALLGQAPSGYGRIR
jgi:hypothetical protein